MIDLERGKLTSALILKLYALVFNMNPGLP